jgi:ABC-type nitrate/sulfonate/bicarbonate transport system substrate-binding protein
MLFRAAYNLPVTAGAAHGVFARHGLELEVTYTRGSKMLAAALASGAVDLGVLAADDVVYEVETRGSDLFMFMGLHAGILVLVARPGLTASDLAGRRLGVDDPASGFALVAARLLAMRGLGPTQYAVVEVGGHELRARALERGEIDVALLTPPFSLTLERRGFTILARAHDHLPRYQASAGVTTRRWAEAHDEVLLAYVRAYREGLAWILAPEGRAVGVEQLEREFGLDPELAGRTWAALADPADGLFRDASLDMEGIETVLRLRVEAGLLPAPPDAGKYVDLRYLQRA